MAHMADQAICPSLLDAARSLLYMSARATLVIPHVTEVCDGACAQRYGPGLRSSDDRGQDPIPRLDRRQLGGDVLTSEGFYAGVHHRTRLHGQDQAGI